MKKNLFNIPSPDYLRVADKPICDETATIRRLNGVQEILDELHFNYCEDVIVTDSTQAFAMDLARQDPRRHVKSIDPNARARLRRPLNETLVICHINEDVNYGLFTSAPIKCGDCIGIYAGQATCKQPIAVELPPQLHSLYDSLVKQCIQGDYRSGVDGVDAAISGGILRYANHMPMDFPQRAQAIKTADHESLSLMAKSMGYISIPDNDQDIKKTLQQDLAKTMKTTFNPQVAALLKNNPQLATANMNNVHFSYKGFLLEMMVANRDIEANEQLGWDYQLLYWQGPCRQNQQCFFDRNTGTVSSIRLDTPQIPLAPQVFQAPVAAVSATSAFPSSLSVACSIEDLGLDQSTQSSKQSP